MSSAEATRAGLNERSEPRSLRPLPSDRIPSRILVIRLHAIGDIAVTLPSVVALRQNYPSSTIDLLTTQAGTDLVGALDLFDQVWTIADAGSVGLPMDLPMAARLRGRRYDLVIDLQRNRRSRLVRRLSGARWWTEFDRFSPVPAGTRVFTAFLEGGIPGLIPSHRLPFRDQHLRAARLVLQSRGWNEARPLLVLNPAGLWPSRRWRVESYVEAGHLFVERHAGMVLCLGTGRILDAARAMSEALGKRCIVVANETTLAQAFAILALSTGMISDDSGLMHMAWAAGIPTIALFGSTDFRQSAPVGDHVRVLHSGDLPCGACAEANCRFGDTHCLTRYSPENVIAELESLLSLSGEGRSA
jgi:heptosyltransferase II